MWLKDSLPRAYDDPELKQRIKRLLGAPRLAPNLAHLGLWTELMADCKARALALGQDMQRYYVESDLGTVLGEGVVPNVFGTFQVREDGHHVVVPCVQEEGVRRQDGAMPGGFPRDRAHSQLWNEACFIHCIRMIAMGIDESFQSLVSGVCEGANGAFKGCTIKGFVRMYNKCVSYADHYWDAYPRPSLNIDLNRNACTFENPEDLLSFIDTMKARGEIGSHPVRVKNMFLFDEARAEQQFFYRTVMINWLYTPGITYGDLAKQAQDVWDNYYNFQHVEGYGEMDPSESWGTWRQQIEVARAYLTSREIQDKPVQFIVETQLLLRPYLEGRCKMHLLYKIVRADNPEALHSDFRTIEAERRSFDEVQDAAQQSMQAFLAGADGAHCRGEGSGDAATRLWIAAEQGHEKAVREMLQHGDVDPNKIREGVCTSPLYIASYHGHEAVVRAFLADRRTRVNCGKTDVGMSPLVAAAQEGREGVVKALLEADGIDVNQATTDGVTPLLKACHGGREHIVELLLEAESVDVYAKLASGATGVSLAGSHGNVRIVEMLVARFRRESRGSCRDFPLRSEFQSDEQYRESVLAWAKDANLPETAAGSLHNSNSTRMDTGRVHREIM